VKAVVEDGDAGRPQRIDSTPARAAMQLLLVADGDRRREKTARSLSINHPA
jgi:hypothetical protein